jgi:pimeloyl-ACP methyl ester carboxylesterase
MLKSLAGGALFGEAWGGSPPLVVALHGWRRTHADFADSIGPGHRAGPVASVAPDLPGFGATPPPSRVWGSEDYAEAVAHLMRSEDGPPGPAVVVGHSLGGRVAVSLACAHPELVGALVLTGAPLVKLGSARSRPSARYRAIRYLRRLHLVGEARMERARRRYGSADYRLAEGVMRPVLVRLVNEDYDEVISSLSCPVELVWGSEDAEAPLAVAHELSRRLPDAKLTVCEGVGHLLPLESPDELRAAVERSMARL